MINIVWVGCHEEGVQAFETILKMGHKVTKFITLNDESFSIRSAGSREYYTLCESYHVPVGLVSTIKNDEAYEMILAAKPDLMVVLGWSEILPERLLDIPTMGTVGAHAALLPHGRGSAPINWAIIKGEKHGGNSLMWLDKEVDKGNIIDQMGFDITPFDTCKTLYDKVAETNNVMLIRLIDRLSNNLPTVMDKQNVTDEELLPRRRPKDGIMNWNQSSRRVYDFVRALTQPYPGAFSYLGGKKYKIWKAALLPMEEANHVSGKIIGPVISHVAEVCGYLVSCATGSVIITSIEDEDGNVYEGKSLIDLKLTGIFENE